VLSKLRGFNGLFAMQSLSCFHFRIPGYSLNLAEGVLLFLHEMIPLMVGAMRERCSRLHTVSTPSAEAPPGAKL
jgi:hypothetical protein